MRRTTLLIGALLAAPAFSQDGPPFGGEEEVGYAENVWSAMTEARLAGDGAITAFPYEGVQPHGMLLETIYTTLEVDGHEGTLIVKRNHAGEDLTPADVVASPSETLDSVTIMFQREDGYDSETGNWFYAKYLPDGSLDQNPNEVPLAGLVGKGGDAGCIPCHAGAEGDDYLFTTDNLVSASASN